jgi:hypothetical protein
MSAVEAELQRITFELEERGFAQTTFDRLGLSFDDDAAQSVEHGSQSRFARRTALSEELQETTATDDDRV